MRVAVVGHVEHVEFVEVARLPKAGEIVHARSSFTEAAGGGGVAAVQLAKLAGTATLFTALGDDERGHQSKAQLAGHGVTVMNAWRDEPQRRGIVFLDDANERTITILGKRHQLAASDVSLFDVVDPVPTETAADAPARPIAARPLDAVYFTAGDADVLRRVRALTRVLVATSRVLPILEESGVFLDAVVRSDADPGEPDPLAPSTRLTVTPALVATTEGARGGRYVATAPPAGDGPDGGAHARGAAAGRWQAAPLPGPAVDAYGCGDSFAAGLAFALGRGDDVDAALAFAAKCGASCLTGRGPFAGQLRP